MSPVRIVILAVLFYVLYRLIFWKKKVKHAPPRPVSEGPASGDVLVEDPFCHTYVPKKQAIQAIKNGEKFYFCSDRCCQAFLNDKAQDPHGNSQEGDKS